MDERTIQVTVVGGRIGFALRQLGDGEGVEVEVSNEGVPLLQRGCYDIDAGARRITVSAGDALSGGSGPNDVRIQPAARDELIEWCRSRDHDETWHAAPYYVSPYMTGFAELDAAGNWESTAEYGAVWVPT